MRGLEMIRSMCQLAQKSSSLRPARFSSSSASSSAPIPKLTPVPKEIQEILFPNDQPIVLRDFISSSLYHPTFGYFSRPKSVVRSLHSDPITFSKLKDKSEYAEAVRQKVYRQGEGGSWRTPVELFSPYFGRSIARYIASKCSMSPPGSDSDGPIHLHIVELGPGNGTLGLQVLDFFSQNLPNFYQNMTYDFVDISSSMSRQQQSTVSAHAHPTRTKFHAHSALDLHDYGPRELLALRPSKTPKQRNMTFVIGLELLDNLPHDKVWLQRLEKPSTAVHPLQAHVYPTPQPTIEEWESVHQSFMASQADAEDPISLNPPPPFDEVFAPLNDPLISTCLQATGLVSPLDDASGEWTFQPEVTKQQKKADIVYLPTGALKLIQSLRACFASSLPSSDVHMMLYDFTHFPFFAKDNSLLNAPHIHSTIDGHSVEYTDYLCPSFGSADIYFPTDFNLFQKLFASEFGTQSTMEILKNKEFFQRYASKEDIQASKLKSGHSPLLSEYNNASFFLT